METPRHSDERGHHDETDYGQSHTLVNATTGAPILTAPLSSHTRTVFEKFCAGCGQWVEVRGVFGMIEWLATHDGHKLTTDVLQ